MVWKVVNIADSGTASKHGADDLDKVAKGFSGIDVDDYDINSDWYFRSGRFNIRNPANTFGYNFIGDAILGNRIITIPLTAGDGSMVLSNFDNVFTRPQMIQHNANADLLYLYKDINTIGTTTDLNFDFQDSAGGRDTYADIRATIVDNTAGSEDGSFQVNVIEAGTKSQKLKVNADGILDIGPSANPIRLWADGLSAPRTYTFPNQSMFIAGANFPNTFTQRQTIQRDGTGNLFTLYRTDNASTNNVYISYNLEDSNGNETEYARTSTEIFTNTDGTEDGSYKIATVGAGSLTNKLVIGADGSLTILPTAVTGDAVFMYRPTNSLNDNLDINFDFNNSAAARVTYGDLRMVLIEDNNGAEEGRFQVNVMNDGSKEEMLRVQNGRLTVGHAGTGLGSIGRAYTQSGTAVHFDTSSAENTLFTQNILAGDIGANGCLHLLLFGSIRQQTVTSTTYTLRIKFGGTTGYQDDVLSAYATSSANFMIYRLDLWVYNTNNASAQNATGLWTLNDNASVTTGWGDITDDEGQGGQTFATSWDKDTAGTNNSLAVTMQATTSSVNVEYNVDYKLLEIHPS